MTAPIRRRSLLKGILGGVAAVAAGGALAHPVAATEPTVTISGPIAEPVSITNESLHATLTEMSGEPWITYRDRFVDDTVRRVQIGPFDSGAGTFVSGLPRLDDLP